MSCRSSPIWLNKLRLFAVTALALAGGCAADLSHLAAYYEKAPRTILVVPVRNETTAVEAERFFMSTILRPLAERGYYVLPVEPAAEILKQEGIYEGEAWEIAPQRLFQYFGADAVLYITIEKWDTAYAVVASSVTVAISYRLVDTRSNSVIWKNHAVEEVTSKTPGSGNPIIDLIGMTIDAAVTAAATDYVPLASRANTKAMMRLPPGFYHPRYENIQEEIREWKRARASQ